MARDLKKKREHSPCLGKGMGDQIMWYAQQSHFQALEVVGELALANELQNAWMMRVMVLLQHHGLDQEISWPSMPDTALSEMRVTGKYLMDINRQRVVRLAELREPLEKKEEERRRQYLRWLGARPAASHPPLHHETAIRKKDK